MLYLLVGESGSGKTTLAKYLQDHYGLKVLESYTTRPKRSPDETGHIFITKDEADYIMIHDKIVADTKFDGNIYFATQDQVEEADVYIVDPAGLVRLLHNYSGDKTILSFFIRASEKTRVKRKRDRGDSEDAIKQRLENDGWQFRNVTCVDWILNGEHSTKRMAKAMMLYTTFYMWITRCDKR